ncbi:hypothetical protein [uncultured Aquimarina sp.]|uniref:hypothetical protein n=1 Tax=uncultured Aquimarina sp. TaxID=575652 RepID=UPI0026028682|nr:hypothetical protein [uncultured Aquimarina sp.]
MKAKKVIWGLLITIIAVSCSTDDSIIQNTKNSEEVINKSSSFDPEEGGEEEEEEEIDYGMPFDNSYNHENEHFIIKIVYTIENEESQVDIRRRFSQEHPDLVLVKVADSTSEFEYWFLKYLSGKTHSRGSQDLPEEDKDPTQVDEFDLLEYHNILNKIRQDERIELY